MAKEDSSISAFSAGELASAGIGWRVADDDPAYWADVRERHAELERTLAENERRKRRARAAEARGRTREGLAIVKAAERAGRLVKRATIEGVVIEFGVPAATTEALTPAGGGDLTEWDIALGSSAPPQIRQ
jgi:hypothetical protein